MYLFSLIESDIPKFDLYLPLLVNIRMHSVL